MWDLSSLSKESKLDAKEVTSVAFLSRRADILSDKLCTVIALAFNAVNKPLALFAFSAIKAISFSMVIEDEAGAGAAAGNPMRGVVSRPKLGRAAVGSRVRRVVPSPELGRGKSIFESKKGPSWLCGHDFHSWHSYQLNLRGLRQLNIISGRVRSWRL